MTEVDRLEYIISADPSQAVQAFKETGTEYDKMDKKLSASSSSQFGTNIASGANTAKGAIGTLSGALDTLTSKLKGISAGQAFSAIESGASKAARTMQGIGIAATAVGVPVGLLAKSSLSAFAELESQIQRDVSLIGGGKAEFQELLDLSKQLGETTPFNTTEIARGVESLAAAGYSMDQIKAAMGTVTEMSIAAGEPLEAMSDILVNVLSQFGGAATDAEHFADVLAVGANESTASITDMGEALKYAGNMAPITQKSVEEFSAALTVMANNGIKGTMAGTGLVDILGDLAKPAAPAQEALKELGLTKEDIDPATNSLEELLTTLNRVGLADPANLDKLYTIFGKQGAPKISSLISDEGLAKYKEIVDKMVNESTNANKRMADAQRDTLDYALQQISESFQKVQLAIGEGLKPLALELNQFLLKNGDTITTFAKNAVEGLTPFVKKILELGKSFMEWFNSLPSDMQGKVASLTGLGAAVAAIGGPLLLLGSLPVAAIGNIAGVFKSLFEIGGATATGTGVASLVSSLTQLSKIPAIPVAQYLAPIGPAAAGAAGEVGLLTSALATLGGPIGAGALVAVTAGLAAYTTNFGDFRDNINAILSDVGSAAANIATGDYEQAGRDSAEAFGDGFETVTDLVGGIVQGLPAAFNFANPFNNSGRQSSSDFFEGFGAGAVQGIAAQKPAVEEAIRLLTSESAAKDEIPNAIRGWFSGFSLHDEGFNLAETLSDGFLSFKFGPMWGPVLSGAVKEAAKIASGESGKVTPDKTETDRIVESKVSKYIEDGLTSTAANYKAATDYYTNRAAHSGGYGSVQINPSEVSSAVTQGLQDGSSYITQAVSDGISDTPVKTTGFDEYKAEKNKGLSDREKFSDASLQKMYESNPKLIAKYEAVAAAKAEEAEATKGGTASKKKLTTIEAALADNAIGLNDSFKTADGVYKKIIENGAYVAQEQGASAELLRYNQEQTEKQAAEDKAAQDKISDAKKSYAEQIERAKLDYSQAIRSSKTPDAIESAKNSYQFKIEDIQLKAQQTGVDISDLNTTLDKTGSTVDILNTKYTDFNKDLIQQLRELELEKQKKITTAAEKGKIADTDSLDKRIKKLQDEISNNEAELKKSTTTQRDNISTVKESIQTQGDAKKAVIEFGPAVDAGTESVNTFVGKMGAVDVEGMFKALFSDVNLREILEDGLNYQADMGVGRKAPEEERAAYKEGLENNFIADSSSEILKSIDWARNIGEPIEEAFAEGGAVWAAVSKNYLEDVRGARGITDSLGWVQNEQIRDRMSGKDYVAVKAILDNFKTLGQDIYSGKTSVNAAGGFSESMGQWWGSSYSAIQKTDGATQNLTNSLNELNTVQYASDARATALKQAYDQVQSASVSLEGYLSDNKLSMSEAAQYLNQYNQESGQQIQYSQQQIGQSHEMLSAIMQISAAQSTYSQYMSDGSLSAQEAADMNSQLAEINRLLGDAGVTATGGVGGLPPALQSLASYASSAVSQINAAISSASAAVASAQKYVQSARSLNWKPDGPGSKISLPASVTQNIDLSNAKILYETDFEGILQTAYQQMAAGAR